MKVIKEDLDVDVRIPLLLKDREAAHLLGISRSYFWKFVAQGKVKPVKISQHCTRFRYRDILAFSETFE